MRDIVLQWCYNLGLTPEVLKLVGSAWLHVMETYLSLTRGCAQDDSEVTEKTTAWQCTHPGTGLRLLSGFIYGMMLCLGSVEDSTTF